LHDVQIVHWVLFIFRICGTPAFDVRNRTAEVAVDLIESLFGKSTLMRKK